MSTVLAIYLCIGVALAIHGFTHHDISLRRALYLFLLWPIAIMQAVT